METLFLYLVGFMLLMTCVAMVLGVYMMIVMFRSWITQQKESKQFWTEHETSVKARQQEYDEIRRRIRKGLGYGSK